MAGAGIRRNETPQWRFAHGLIDVQEEKEKESSVISQTPMARQLDASSYACSSEWALERRKTSRPDKKEEVTSIAAPHVPAVVAKHENEQCKRQACRQASS